MNRMLLTTGVFLLGCSSPDNATWRTETASPDTDTDTDTDWEDDEDFLGKSLWGEVEDGGGATGYYYETEDQGVLCDVVYLVDAWEETDACPDCAVAWSINRGESFTKANENGTCESEGWTGLSGTTIGVGAADDDTLWADLGNGWEIVDAEGEAGEEWLFFVISLD